MKLYIPYVSILLFNEIIKWKNDILGNDNYRCELWYGINQDLEIRFKSKDDMIIFKIRFGL